MHVVEQVYELRTLEKYRGPLVRKSDVEAPIADHVMDQLVPPKWAGAVGPMVVIEWISLAL